MASNYIPLVFLARHTHWSIPLYVLAVIWVGSRQHSLAVLMHEGAHFHLSNNRFINNLISELFLAYPLLISTFQYRKSHFAHHIHLNTGEDPDYVRKMESPERREWIFPQSKRDLFNMLLKDAIGINSIYVFREIYLLSFQGKSDKAAYKGLDALFPYIRVLYYVVVVALITYLKLWLFILLLWIVPLFTFLQFLLRIRSIAEHFAIPNRSLDLQTRTTIPSYLDKIFIGTHHVGYHSDHHYYPSVPYYKLPQLHEYLKNHNYDLYVTRSYYNVLKDCLNNKPIQT